MAYANRTTKQVYTARALNSLSFVPSTIQQSSEEPPHSGLVSVVTSASQVGTIAIIEGKLPGSTVWVALAYMVAAAPGTGVPGTDGVSDATAGSTTFVKSLTVYPRTRMRMKAGTGAMNATGWIQA